MTHIFYQLLKGKKQGKCDGLMDKSIQKEVILQILATFQFPYLICPPGLVQC